ncbi:hypothetical protein ORIO_02990 [Cereibacter azotoformans]|uniref:Uncharacterized protein n=1 Tax=Cereibacter sphaeroides (strain ATCC 17025 / ATH 2.4.3) TaxID=349102 RepID=A4WQ32_CERS5|nr:MULTISPECIES: hypothetical protein [Cereibacter]AXQ92814.1 hypothetical protein D0Z66_02650 [Cereibacter sphaeroides]MBO4169520.1 hypothetical protein [Cereibacter azotoformans]UIJ31098.1 hypothetical protein LV780_02660 [Cereibacter azotoformans]ULB08897.1 hypothetical protein ORIO_02990 [Cereibacter azotoformans]
MSGKAKDQAPQGATGGKASPGAKGPAAESREDRLKAALKANMARRKAQAKARAAREAGPEDAPE